MTNPAPSKKWYNVQSELGGISGSTVAALGLYHRLKLHQKTGVVQPLVSLGCTTYTTITTYYLLHRSAFLNLLNLLQVKILKYRAFTCLTNYKKTTATHTNTAIELIDRSAQPTLASMQAYTLLLLKNGLSSLYVGSPILQKIKALIFAVYKALLKIKIVKLLFSIMFFKFRKSAHPLKSHR